MMDRRHSSFKRRHELRFDKERQEICDFTKSFETSLQAEIYSEVTPTLFVIAV